MPTERKTTAAPVIVAAVLLLVVLPMLYVLSVGPLVAAEQAGWVPQGVDVVLKVAYSPLRWLYGNCQPVRTALDFYIGLWGVEPPGA